MLKTGYVYHDDNVKKYELDYMKEVFCEACKGLFCIGETACYETCDGFIEELTHIREEGELDD